MSTKYKPPKDTYRRAVRASASSRLSGARHRAQLVQLGESGALQVFLIDDVGTREVDDGVSIEDLGGGHYRIWAHIADPSRLLLPGSVLDSHAASRSTSVYLPDQTVMMFPKDIVLQAMSLMTGQVRQKQAFVVTPVPSVQHLWEPSNRFINPAHYTTENDIMFDQAWNPPPDFLFSV